MRKPHELVCALLRLYGAHSWLLKQDVLLQRSARLVMREYSSRCTFERVAWLCCMYTFMIRTCVRVLLMRVNYTNLDSHIHAPIRSSFESGRSAMYWSVHV
jgi:hypothetical protein